MTTLNKFLTTKISSIQKRGFSKDCLDLVYKQAEFFNDIDIDSEDKLKKFHHISQYVPVLVRRALGRSNQAVYSKVYEYLFDSDWYNINSLYELQHKVIEALSVDNSLNKYAYPFSISEDTPLETYNVQRWAQTLDQIILKVRLFGEEKRNQIILEATKDWNDMERKKFLNWTRYYTGNYNKLYRIALQNISTENISIPMGERNIRINPVFQMGDGQSIPIEPVPGLIPEMPKPIVPESPKTNKEEQFEKVRAGLIGRINAAIKILTKRVGRQFAGKDFERLLNSFVALKRDIYLLNNDSMLADVIARQEAILIKAGYADEAKMLVKIAQTAPPPLPFEPSPPGAETPVPPPMPGGNVPADSKEPKEAVIKAIKGMFPDTDKKENKKASWADVDSPQVKAVEKIAEAIQIMIEAALNGSAITITSANKEYRLHKIAQRLNMIDEPIRPVPHTPNVFFPEDAIDKAFASVKISDVTKRLQALSNVFKNREIARQLNIVDIMLDKLGIAGFFPALAEATRSALESNQYCQIRIEEILSKLMSVVDDKGLSMIDAGVSNKKPPETLIDSEMKKSLEAPKTVINPEAAVMPETALELPPAPPAKPIAAPINPLDVPLAPPMV